MPGRYVYSGDGRRASVYRCAVIIFCVRLLQVCSFSYDGQYQSLDEWNEQTVRLSRFFFINQSPTRSALRHLIDKTFAKGRTNCEAERDIIVQGYTDLLKVLKQAKLQKETGIKAELYDIIFDTTISDEERQTQMRPFYDVLSEQEETDRRIRRSILIGLFSFWELSLKEVCEYYKLDVAAAKEPKPKKKNKSQNNEPHYGENDYLKAIFHTESPDKVDVISSKIRELRNYMTHGTAGATRKVAIDTLISTHPEFCISKECGDYSITSYDGLEQIMDTIKESLFCAEATAKQSKEQSNQ